eukprot:c7648_g2_i1 orf=58-318(-)
MSQLGSCGRRRERHFQGFFAIFRSDILPFSVGDKRHSGQEKLRKHVSFSKRRMGTTDGGITNEEIEAHVGSRLQCLLCVLLFSHLK